MGIEYVPAGVTPTPVLCPPELPEMMPEEVQLETPPAMRASSATSSSALRRRLKANGTSTSPQASERTGHADGRTRCADEVGCPVAISTCSLPVVLAGMLSLVGLKVQVE